MTTDTPCAGCPSPILEGCPRFSELRLVGTGGVIVEVDEYHPGCWVAELRAEDHQQSHTDVRPSKESAHA